MPTLTIDQLLEENEDLRRRLEEAEDALRALRAGEVDAVFIEAEREQVYTLETADKPYRLLVEQIPHAAASLTADGRIIYCNHRFADLLQWPIGALLGKPIVDFVASDDRSQVDALLRDRQGEDLIAAGRQYVRPGLPRRQYLAGRRPRLVPDCHRPDRTTTLPGAATRAGGIARRRP